MPPMTTNPHRSAIALAILFLTLAAGAPAHADDTELFVSATDDGGARPNVLFIIDTSGSMGAQVLTQAPWDSGQTFSGCYRSDALYFSATTTPPDCASESWVPKAQNFCQASATALDVLGQFTGMLLAWDGEREVWGALDGNARDRPAECQTDRGSHGDGSSVERYAADGPAGPWATTDEQEPAWNSQYTVFDGNWLNWRSNPPTVSRTRLEVVQSVVNSVVASLQGVDVGLMRFNLDEGGAVVHAQENVDTARADIQNAVNGLGPGGLTPLSETLYEAGLYLRGGNVDYGNVGPGYSVAESRVGGALSSGVYRTPITASCQQNFIVLLTDGEPASDSSANAKIPALPGFAETVGAGCDGTGEGACLDDMAAYLFGNDLNPLLPGVQNAITHVIGFTIDLPLLAGTAQRGGGQYYLADDTASLASALTQLVQGIAERTGTFTAPAIPVNVFNRAESLNDVYVSLFEPSGTARWPGNLKKYRLANGQLVGQDGQPAVDARSGFFAPTAWSFWSAARDGDRVQEGGAASRLPADTARTLFTVTGDETRNVALAAEENRVDVTNTEHLTADLLGVPETEREALIEWARGRDVTDVDQDGDLTETRRDMGDPLHVRPLLVTYGGTAQNPVSVVYVATNDGYLHAINASDGSERWAFIPKRLLARLHELQVNAPTSVRRYGLDGELRLFVLNDDGQPGFDGPDETPILLFGMGRGGDGVFALNVKDPDEPVQLWEIDSRTDGYQSLGQTWSTPVPARVNYDGELRWVAFFGGGYDPGQDNRGYRPEDAVGNAMLMADLLTGEWLWSAGEPDAGHDLALADMQHSIPASPRVLDISGDGLADRIYAGDMGGRLWRIDLLNGNGRSQFATGGVLASLGAADLDDPPDSAVRRFYATPDVVLTVAERRTILAVNIGSGYRGHPLDTDVSDAFFSVRDAVVFPARTPGSYEPPIRVGDLADITDEEAPELRPDAAGWLLRMVQSDGEKILTPALTLNNTVFFTSFSPGGGSACVAGPGINRFYQVSVLDGRAITNLDGSADDQPLTIEDRFIELRQTNIAPAPAFATDERGEQFICVGLECFPVSGPGRLTNRTFWVQEQPE